MFQRIASLLNRGREFSLFPTRIYQSENATEDIHIFNHEFTIKQGPEAEPRSRRQELDRDEG